MSVQNIVVKYNCKLTFKSGYAFNIIVVKDQYDILKDRYEYIKNNKDSFMLTFDNETNTYVEINVDGRTYRFDMCDVEVFEDERIKPHET